MENDYSMTYVVLHLIDVVDCKGVPLWSSSLGGEEQGQVAKAFPFVHGKVATVLGRWLYCAKVLCISPLTYMPLFLE